MIFAKKVMQKYDTADIANVLFAVSGSADEKWYNIS